MTVAPAPLQAAFPNAQHGVSADGIPFVLVRPEHISETLRLARDELGYVRWVDLTAVDEPTVEPRFELQYLLYSMTERRWLRIKTQTDDRVPTVIGVFPGANWYERELFDLFGVEFEGHPDLTRIGLRGGIALTLASITPPAGLLATLELGPGEDANCGGRYAH